MYKDKEKWKRFATEKEKDDCYDPVWGMSMQRNKGVKMMNEVLRKYIPSKSYVEYLDEIGHEFTDFETAGILYHIIEDWETKMDELLKMAVLTEDSVLKEQIKVKAEYEKKKLEAFKDNSSGDAAYMVEYVDEEEPDFYTPIAGFAADYETAYAIGLRTESKFTISKRALYSQESGMNVRTEEKSYLNPYIGRDKDWDIHDASEDELREECEADAVGSNKKVADYSFGDIRFNSKGRPVGYYISDPDDDALEIMEKTYSGKLFYNSFIEFPFPFEQGDFVRLVDNDEDRDRYSNGCRCVIGIVDTTRERYEKFLERAKSIYVDAFDASVTVQFMYEDGRFMHDHIMPLFLEKVEPDKDADWYDLAQNAAWMIKGEGSLDFFIYAYEKRKAEYGRR